MKQTRFLSHINKIGIFASSLLLTVTAVYLYSPILGSHAGDGVTTRFEAVINPVASITLDTSDLVFDIAPTASGTFSSSPVTATVSTNSLGGYELYFSSEDDETDMIHDDAEISDVIASDFSGTVTSETMGANKWGYSLDNVDFLKIPTATNQLELRNIDHYPEAAEKTNTIYIGTKISTALTSGLYSKDVKFTAVAHDNPPAIPSMANFDKTTLANVGDSVEVEDSRDGEMYVVKKLADGNVWMVEGLRLGGDEPITLTSENSDVESDFVLPASSMTGFSSSNANNNSVYVDETYGGYYSYYTATAGEGGTNKTSGNVSHSICPKGWRLPTIGEYQTLYSNYNSVSALQGAPGFVYNGFMMDNNPSSQGIYGSVWSASVASAQGAYLISFMNDSVFTGTSPSQAVNKASGGAVRCIAR